MSPITGPNSWLTVFLNTPLSKACFIKAGVFSSDDHPLRQARILGFQGPGTGFTNPGSLPVGNRNWRPHIRL